MFSCRMKKKDKLHTQNSSDDVRVIAENTMSTALGVSLDRYRYLKSVSNNNIELLFFLHNKEHDLNNRSCENLLSLSK